MMFILSTETQVDNPSLRYFQQQVPRALGISSPSFGVAHMILGRIECDSQNWTRRRSRYSHRSRNGSPMVGITCLMSAPTSVRAKLYSARMEICRTCRCSDVIVWSARVIHSTFGDVRRKTASLDFCRLRDVDRSRVGVTYERG